MPRFFSIARRIDNYKQKTADGIQNVKEVVIRSGVVALIATIIVWLAVFAYVAFYYAYMPSITHSRPVYLQFKSCEDTKGICSFPSAHVELTKKQQLLMVGQPYKIVLNLEMPESPANKRLGMFMVCIQMNDQHSTLVSHACRSTMLHYRSRLLHTISTIILSPLFIYGQKEEKQIISVELFPNFEENQDHPVTDIYVEVQSRHVELYSATLHINAHFTGLRYLMFHWPILSASIGIMSNLFFIVIILGLSWAHLHKSYEEYEGDEPEVEYKYSKTSNKKEIEERLFGETDDSSFEDASFNEDSSKADNDNGHGSSIKHRSSAVKVQKGDSFLFLSGSAIEELKSESNC